MMAKQQTGATGSHSTRLEQINTPAPGQSAIEIGLITQAQSRLLRQTTEHSEQMLAMQRREQYKDLYPDLYTLHSTPNAGKRGRRLDERTGRWYSPEGQNLKAEGMVAGIPDIHWPIARHGYHSLYVEMKHNGASVEPAQRDMILRLRSQGNLVVVLYTGVDLWNMIVWYGGLPGELFIEW
jgi:hypothetical protein